MVWFRNDLRIHDHEPLYKAALKFNDIIPVYCFDPRQFQKTFLGFPKTGSFRAQFMIEAVRDLQKSLRKIGSDLVIRVGNPEEVLIELVKHLNIKKVYCSKEITKEEVDIENKLETGLWALGVSLETFCTHTLYHPGDIPFPTANIPDTFSQFRKAIESVTQIRSGFLPPDLLKPLKGIPVGNLPSLSDLGLEGVTYDKRAVLQFKGGESQGLTRLQDYIWTKDLLRNYKKTRNGLLGEDYSSKISPWLALGCISPRKVYEEVKKYENQITKNQSTYWLIFELLWRDYFKLIAKKYGNAIFKLSGIKPSTKPLLTDNRELFEQWASGKTGIPFIDANMRELNQSGFMSNRGRQNVASFLVKDLKINWVWGAMYFESKLLDYDVCSNWGNWAYVAGVGNDPRENRYFNILSQAKKYDSQGKYVKHWIPELSSIPGSSIHQVYQMDNEKRDSFSILNNYPRSVIASNYWV